MADRISIKYPHKDEKVQECRSCKAKVWWRKMESGKWMPIEAEGEKAGESHFAHCKDADTWRKKESKTRKVGFMTELELVALFNKSCPSLPTVKIMKEKSARWRKTKKILKEHPDKNKRREE